MRINIELNKTPYAIDVDDKCYTAIAFSTNGDKESANYGKITEKQLGYFSRLSNAALRLCREEVFQSDSVVSLKEYSIIRSEPNLKAFSVLNDGIVEGEQMKIIVNPNPKTNSVGSYFEDGKISFPTVYMILVHVKTGTKMLVERLNRMTPYNHEFHLKMMERNKRFPKVKADDIFGFGGYLAMEELELREQLEAVGV